MKKEVSFFKDKRGGFSAKNLLAMYRSLGYTDAQIREEMLKIKAAQPAEPHMSQNGIYSDNPNDDEGDK